MRRFLSLCLIACLFGISGNVWGSSHSTFVDTVDAQSYLKSKVTGALCFFTGYVETAGDNFVVKDLTSVGDTETSTAAREYYRTNQVQVTGQYVYATLYGFPQFFNVYSPITKKGGTVEYSNVILAKKLRREPTGTNRGQQISDANVGIFACLDAGITTTSNFQMLYPLYLTVGGNKVYFNSSTTTQGIDWSKAFYHSGQLVSLTLAGITSSEVDIALASVSDSLSPSSTIQINDATSMFEGDKYLRDVSVRSVTYNKAISNDTSAYSIKKLEGNTVFTTQHKAFKSTKDTDPAGTEGTFTGSKVSVTGLTKIQLVTNTSSSTVSLKNMFYDCESLLALDGGYFLESIPDGNGEDIASITLSGYDSGIALENFYYSRNSNTSYVKAKRVVKQRMNTADLVTTKLIDASGMFYNCKLLTSLDLSGLQTSGLDSSSLGSVNFANMFNGCKKLTTLHIANGFIPTSWVTWQSGYNPGETDVVNVNKATISTNTSMTSKWASMFAGCTSLVVHEGDEELFKEKTVSDVTLYGGEKMTEDQSPKLYVLDTTDNVTVRDPRLRAIMKKNWQTWTNKDPDATGKDASFPNAGSGSDITGIFSSGTSGIAHAGSGDVVYLRLSSSSGRDKFEFENSETSAKDISANLNNYTSLSSHTRIVPIHFKGNIDFNGNNSRLRNNKVTIGDASTDTTVKMNPLSLFASNIDFMPKSTITIQKNSNDKATIAASKTVTLYVNGSDIAKMTISCELTISRGAIFNLGKPYTAS